MIYGIGTDICNIQRIEKVYQKSGSIFVERLLTISEIELFEKSAKKAAFLAKRFAIKEAVSKALGTGIGANLSFQDIEISRQNGQRPKVVVQREEFKHLKIHISVSDEEHYAIAYAIAEEK